MTRTCPRPCPDRRRNASVALLLALLCLAAFTAESLADYKTAISLFKRQKYRDALKELQPDVSRNPDWEFGHRLAGLCYFYLKEYDNAIRAFERAAELKSTEPSVYLGLAESYYQAGKPDQALAALERGKATSPRKRTCTTTTASGPSSFTSRKSSPRRPTPSWRRSSTRPAPPRTGSSWGSAIT